MYALLMDGQMSVREAAQQLGVSKGRIFTLIGEGRLAAQRLGAILVIKRSDLSKLKIGKPGRPRNKAAAKSRR
jgi:excisionase family DNA binding protein